jgi:heme oxygenase
MNEDERHQDDFSSKFRSFGWLLIVAIALLGAALLLKEYGVF